MKSEVRRRALSIAIGTLLLAACSAGDQPPVTTTPAAPPALVANAGPDQSVFLGTFVTLNGSKSTNANQTGLTYAWTLKTPAGSKASLNDQALVNPTMTVDVEGTYEATLVVSDAQNSSAKSAPDTVIVIVSKTNPPPVANIGPTSQSVFTRIPVLLNGSPSSDANKDPLTFRWTLARRPSGSSASLQDATTVAPSFTPDNEGDYTVTLTVNDGTTDSTTDSVTIHASDKPSPIADINPKAVFVLTSPGNITLDATGSHSQPPGAALTYNWGIQSSSFSALAPSSTISTQPTALLTGIPQNAAGTIGILLTVTEPTHPIPEKNSTSTTVLVTVGPLATVRVSTSNPISQLFTCSAATPTTCSATVLSGTALQFDGSVGGLTATDYNYNWDDSGGQSISSNQTQTFTPPKGTPPAGTAYTFTLTVTNKNHPALTQKQSFTITAKDSVSADFTWTPANPNTGGKVTLLPVIPDDPTKLNFKYKWTLVSPPGSVNSGLPNAGLSNTTAQKPDFIPDKPGDYTVTLEVTDPKTRSTDTKSHTITATTPNVKPTADFSISPDPPHVCADVTLDGTKSTDSDGTVAHYHWTLTQPRPDGTTSTSTLADSSKPSFKVTQRQEYSVTLFVTDNSGVNSDTTPPTKFTPVPNPVGQTIFTSTGLQGMTTTVYKPTATKLTRGPACTDCHGPGDNQSGFNLSDSKYTVDFIKSKPVVTDAFHTGTNTTLTGQALTDALTALRNYLDSTLSSCP